jgi:hypothetical protein
MPRRFPRLLDPSVLLHLFTDADVPLIQDVSTDPLIPLVTTVSTTQMTTICGRSRYVQLRFSLGETWEMIKHKRLDRATPDQRRPKA